MKHSTFFSWNCNLSHSNVRTAKSLFSLRIRFNTQVPPSFANFVTLKWLLVWHILRKLRINQFLERHVASLYVESHFQITSRVAYRQKKCQVKGRPAFYRPILSNMPFPAMNVPICAEVSTVREPWWIFWDSSLSLNCLSGRRLHLILHGHVDVVIFINGRV